LAIQIYIGICQCGKPIYKRGVTGPNPKVCKDCAIVAKRKSNPKSIRAKDNPDYYRGWLAKLILNIDMLYGDK